MMTTESTINPPHLRAHTRADNTQGDVGADISGTNTDVPAWVRTTADLAWHFCERAALGNHLTYAQVAVAFGVELLPVVGVEGPAPDDRKPWVEPTVTECATTNRRPATLTISGVDLPNPAPPAPIIAPTAAEILNAVGWLRNRAGLQPVRTAEFESVARIMEGLGAEIIRQAAEISELQGLLEEATPVARFVSELATLSDTEVDFMGVGEIRAAARGKIGEPYGFTLPRLYGEADRNRAVDALRSVLMIDSDTHRVDIVAEALGLRRAC